MIGAPRQVHATVKYVLIKGKKPIFSGHSKIDKTKVLKTNGSLIKVESIAWSILQYFSPALSDNRP